MPDDRAQRLSNLEYYQYLEQAAAAKSAAQVRGIRTEVIRLYRGDPRADDLAEALYAHAERLDGRESWLGLLDTGPTIRGSDGTTHI